MCQDLNAVVLWYSPSNWGWAWANLQRRIGKNAIAFRSELKLSGIISVTSKIHEKGQRSTVVKTFYIVFIMVSLHIVYPKRCDCKCGKKKKKTSTKNSKGQNRNAHHTFQVYFSDLLLQKIKTYVSWTFFAVLLHSVLIYHTESQYNVLKLNGITWQMSDIGHLIILRK